MHRQRGFTLIELLLAMVIIGILAAIAIPSYQGYVERSYRADAQAELLEIAQRLERRYSQTFSYVSAGNPVSAGVPIAQVPKNGDARYLIDLAITESGDAFTLSATPQGPQRSDRCGTLSLNNSGSRTAMKEAESKDGNGDPTMVVVEDCW